MQTLTMQIMSNTEFTSAQEYLNLIKSCEKAFAIFIVEISEPAILWPCSYEYKQIIELH